MSAKRYRAVATADPDTAYVENADGVSFVRCWSLADARRIAAALNRPSRCMWVNDKRGCDGGQFGILYGKTTMRFCPHCGGRIVRREA